MSGHPCGATAATSEARAGADLLGSAHMESSFPPRPQANDDMIGPVIKR
jgi:hypothetical protein